MQSFNCICLLILLHFANAIEKSDVYVIAKLLRPQIKGYVFLRGSPDYETARPVHNGLCKNIYPLMIVKPLNSEDVANAVKMAVKFNLEISVRGGGHSYQCLGIKDNSMNIDLRRLNEIDFYPKSSMVRFGSGVTWNDVLKVVDPEKYTVIHGNARNVGVGGYLLGVGVNPIGTTHRHGYGADNVLQYKMVLADGRIAIVDDNTTTIVYKDGKRVREIYDHDYVPNLRYGLRAAGPSFGIVTEFLYKVYPHPETLSCVVLVYVKTGKDLEKLVKAGQDGRYGISIIQPVIFRKPKPAKWLAWLLIKAPEMLRWQAGKPVLPTIISVVDLQSNNGRSPAGPALAFMKSFGLDVALDNIGLYERFKLDQTNLAVEDQEAVYMTHDEMKNEGFHAITSANYNGLYSYKSVEDLFLYDPDFGMYNRQPPQNGLNDGCDFCLWFLVIMKAGVHDNVISDTKIGPLSWGLDCTYNANDPTKSRNCQAKIKRVRKKFVKNARKNGEKPRQYVNTPAGCREDHFYDFGNRFWGNSYPRLKAIKKYWDPQNVFKYCHSVGSNEDFCCNIDR